MSIAPLKSLFPDATSTQAPAAPPAPATPASNTISIVDFMKLLSTEMASQDPLKPMDPSETMTQLAQFTNLQQTSSLNLNQSLSTANSFLGKQVTVPGLNGAAPVVGVVTAVDASAVAGGGAPQLVIGGSDQEYPVTSVTQVQLAPAAPSQTPTPIVTLPSNSTPSS